MSEKRGLGRKLQTWGSALRAGELLFWRASRAQPGVVCPMCEAHVGVYRDRIVFHPLGNRHPNWREVASSVGPVTKWCPGSDRPAAQLVSDAA